MDPQQISVELAPSADHTNQWHEFEDDEDEHSSRRRRIMDGALLVSE